MKWFCFLMIGLTAVMYPSSEDITFFPKIKKNQKQKTQKCQEIYREPECCRIPVQTCLPRDCWPYEEHGLIASASFLYWKVDQALLDFAYTKDALAQQPTENLSVPVEGLRGEQAKAQFHWDPGLRVNLGYQFNSTPWLVGGDYTWYITSHQDQAFKPFGDGVQAFSPNRIVPVQVLSEAFAAFLVQDAGRAQSAIYLRYNVANLTIARNLVPQNRIILTPYFGAQGAWIKQYWSIEYYEQTFHLPAIRTENWKFRGAGIVAGMNADFCLGAGFSFNAAASVSALYGRYHHTSRSVTNHFFSPVLQDITPQDSRTVQATRLEAGASWVKNFCRWSAKLFAGWEFNSWVNLIETYRFAFAQSVSGNDPIGGNTLPGFIKPRAVDKTNLNLQGFVLSAEAHF